MSAAPTRTLVDGAKSKPAAYGRAVQMSAVLARAGLTERYGVTVHRIPVPRDGEDWGVWLTDRAPDQDPPVGLPFLPPARQFSTAA